MKSTALMFRPLDVLYLRGNRLFGGGGDHGDAMMPPWPSVFSGALYSRAIADEGRLAEVIKEKNGPTVVDEMFGSVSIQWVVLADGSSHGGIYFPLPADLVVLKSDDNPVPVQITTVSKDAFEGSMSSLDPLIPEYPVLRSSMKGKPAGGYWLTHEGLEAHLSGKKVNKDHLISTSKLWKIDPRLGITMDSVSRTAEESRIYTTEAVALSENIGFLCLFIHEKGDLPAEGLVRLGGDGRGAKILGYDDAPAETGKPVSGWKRFRMILSTPCPAGESGWIPPVMEKRGDSYYHLSLNDFEAKLVSAAVPRYEVISGWDVANHKPKPAERMIPAGSVYWFETLRGDTEALEALWKEGLIKNDDKNYADRRRQGFGSVWFGKA